MGVTVDECGVAEVSVSTAEALGDMVVCSGLSPGGTAMISSPMIDICL